MATYSPRFQFRLPTRGAGGSTDDPVSAVFDVAANFSTMDQFMSVQVCTSLTRPPTPIASTLIYETDTGNVMRWSGSGWVTMGTRAGPQGPVAPAATITADIALPTTSPLMSITFNSISATRMFAFSFAVHIQHLAPGGTAGDCVGLALYYKAGPTVDLAGGTLMNGATFQGNNGPTIGNQARINGYWAQNIPISGQITVGLFQGFLQGTQKIEGNATDKVSYFTCRDIGQVP